MMHKSIIAGAIDARKGESRRGASPRPRGHRSADIACTTCSLTNSSSFTSTGHPRNRWLSTVERLGLPRKSCGPSDPFTATRRSSGPPAANPLACSPRCHRAMPDPEDDFSCSSASAPVLTAQVAFLLSCRFSTSYHEGLDCFLPHALLSL